SSVIKGGGRDLSRQAGQVQRGDIQAKTKSINLKQTTAEFKRMERESLEGLKKQIEKKLDETPELALLKKQIILDITSEGLRIQIVDEQNRPMFDLSSAELKPYSKELLREIGKALNAVPNRISLSGHTDASRFAGGERGFSNWELSANRANASRRELILGGMDENKVLRVVGLASTLPFDRNDPLNPANRRITIVVLNKQTENTILQGESEEIPAVGPADISGGKITPPTAPQITPR
ncbi:MAG TPA: flagellar motor protein MotB, partial [Lentisphaeria bacterium]|nr:flagellar motor protein MotB [Lentisphaeria bacterium]